MGRLPTLADFPADVRVSIVPPPEGDQPVNVLLLLHGLGGTQDSFAQLGTQMHLPETVCIAVRARDPLLDLGGYHWGDDIIMFDTGLNSGVDVDAGFAKSTAMLSGVVQDVLVKKCDYALREILLFGYGQGGMAALHLAVNIFQTPLAKDPAITQLGGVISIGAALSNFAPASLDPKVRTPVLVCAGRDESAVSRSDEDKLRYVFQHVEIIRYRKPGDSMPTNRDEMLPIMQFFARRLRSTKGVLPGSVEVLG